MLARARARPELTYGTILTFCHLLILVIEKSNVSIVKKIFTCSSSNATSCLQNHLTRFKKYQPNVDKTQKILALQPMKLNENTMQLLLTWSFDKEECRKFLTRIIIIDELSFKHVEHEGFKDFCNVMQPKFIIPSRYTVAKHCFSFYVEEKNQLKNYFKKLLSRVSYH